MNRLSSATGSQAEPSEACRAEGMLILNLSYGRARSVLWLITLTTVVLGTFRESWIWPEMHAIGVLELISFGSEVSIPKWWSVMQLALASVLLLVNGAAEPNRHWKPFWILLAVIFVFLSIDEGVQIHEQFISVLQPYNFTGFLIYSWIIPYGIASVVIALLYVPFVIALPQRIRWRVIAAGALFLLSALAMESVAGHCATVGNSLCFKLTVIAEESGETIAITLFILALWMLLASRYQTVAFEIRDRNVSERIAFPAQAHAGSVRVLRGGFSAYLAMAFVTFVFQVWVRSSQCQGLEDCGMGFAKAVVWAVIWPASWVVYLAGLQPIHAWLF